jgi:hypothetical protein
MKNVTLHHGDRTPSDSFRWLAEPSFRWLAEPSFSTCCMR